MNTHRQTYAMYQRIGIVLFAVLWGMTATAQASPTHAPDQRVAKELAIWKHSIKVSKGFMVAGGILAGAGLAVGVPTLLVATRLLDDVATTTRLTSPRARQHSPQLRELKGQANLYQAISWVSFGSFIAGAGLVVVGGFLWYTHRTPQQIRRLRTTHTTIYSQQKRMTLLSIK